MDANKLKKLHVINYNIGTCGMCKHSLFPRCANAARGYELSVAYGSCKLHTYDHLKHSDNPRQLSVYRHGRCDDFQADATNHESYVDDSWIEFLKNE